MPVDISAGIWIEKARLNLKNPLHAGKKQASKGSILPLNPKNFPIQMCQLSSNTISDLTF